MHTVITDASAGWLPQDRGFAVEATNNDEVVSLLLQQNCDAHGTVGVCINGAFTRRLVARLLGAPFLIEPVYTEDTPAYDWDQLVVFNPKSSHRWWVLRTPDSLHDLEGFYAALALHGDAQASANEYLDAEDEDDWTQDVSEPWYFVGPEED